MKARILAIVFVATAAAAPFQAAEAGALGDALRNRLGQAVFVGKVIKGNLANAVRSKLRDILR
ncbi:MAG: hypothetical protein ABWX70_05930 [Hyphomicrobium sp.]